MSPPAKRGIELLAVPPAWIVARSIEASLATRGQVYEIRIPEVLLEEITELLECAEGTITEWRGESVWEGWWEAEGDVWHLWRVRVVVIDPE